MDPLEPWKPEDLLDLALCRACGCLVPRRIAELGHVCASADVQEQLSARFSAELETGTFATRIEHWLTQSVEARLRREYLAWQAAGCPSWAEWAALAPQVLPPR
jgi:hypothetical protein